MPLSPAPHHERLDQSHTYKPHDATAQAFTRTFSAMRTMPPAPHPIWVIMTQVRTRFGESQDV